MTVSATGFNALAASTTASTSGSTTTSTTASDSTSTDKNKELFLNLLVAQLKYQDPTNPTDTSQFISQTAMFQQLESINDMKEQITALQLSQSNLGASSMIGKTVSYTDSQGKEASGTVTGVTFGTSGPTFTVGDDTVAMSAVTGVKDASTATTTTSA